MKKKIYSLLAFLGIYPKIGYFNLLGLKFYYRDLGLFKKQMGNETVFPLGKPYRILRERYAPGGTMSGHYFHQDLHVAKLIFKNGPEKHIDIGSRTDGFVAHVATFREIEVLDIRPIKSKVENIIFKQADLMQLPEGMENYCDSISSLHAIEHFGLGRYNDPIDYFGYLKALKNIHAILKPGGKFYFSVPIGEQRVEFNAHRVFSISYLMEILMDDYSLDSFAYVNDKGDLIVGPEMSSDNINSNFGCKYGCGIFEMTKKQ